MKTFKVVSPIWFAASLGTMQTNKWKGSIVTQYNGAGRVWLGLILGGTGFQSNSTFWRCGMVLRFRSWSSNFGEAPDARNDVLPTPSAPRYFFCHPLAVETLSLSLSPFHPKIPKHWTRVSPPLISATPYTFENTVYGPRCCYTSADSIPQKYWRRKNPIHPGPCTKLISLTRIDKD